MSTLAASTSRSGVIVLNTDNTTLHTVSVQHAIRMLVREVAIVEEAAGGPEDRSLSVADRAAADPLREDDLPLRPVAGLVQAGRAAPRSSPMRLLQGQGRDRRPPAAAVSRRCQHLAEHSRRLHPLQQPEGEPHAVRGRHAARLEALGADLA